MQNPYILNQAKIEKITQETEDIKTFDISFLDDKLKENFNYIPGQFVMFSAFGVGEAPFCISSSPTVKGYFQCSIKKMGKVTQEIHHLEEGDIVGIRGPYGNGFPVAELKGKNLLFVAGGIGLAPLRSLINYAFTNRDDFKSITIVNGARTSKDLVYKKEYPVWEKAKDTHLHLTVDCREDNWSCMVGVVPRILEEIKPSCVDSAAIVCGPPVMIRFTIPVLLKLGFCEEAIITTLERQMQCGLGICGHCMVGGVYVCKDGPVFSYAQIKKFTEQV